ncbi:cell division protein FtsQ/DivIB [Frigidibacter sp. RF13]|uniref:cell division protein FtsQ/DivIB n=1 Tax=Frigidibacter sp. RF13 TaxID=2997340 RepID=UPI00226E3D4F|nr:cell division protein FtsQ/DivIB [Frigidibacter sp. RF13]MCY1127406.1 cell division protein FtsQ/DivIB [Frigidibacter sp. RF13]
MPPLMAGERPVWHRRAGAQRPEPPITAHPARREPPVRMPVEDRSWAPAGEAPFAAGVQQPLAAVTEFGSAEFDLFDQDIAPRDAADDAFDAMDYEPDEATARDAYRPVFATSRRAEAAVGKFEEDDIAGYERAAAAIARASDILKRPVAAMPSRRAEAAPVRTAVRRSDRRMEQGERRDPAPSRLAYRMDRLWLTPLFRRFMRYGVPVLTVALAAGIYLGDADRRAAIGASFASLRSQIENRPEFMVKLMSIDGASVPVANAVRAMVTEPLPTSSFRLDLEAMRAAIEQVDAVESATVKLKPGGVLAVDIRERKPAVLWRTEASLEMLDATGHRVATLKTRGARADLPVIAGVGAEERVPEALNILAAARPVLPRVRGLVRVGDRRWDLVLDRGQRLMLPETGAVEAVERVMALDTAEEMLARDLVTVDLRNPNRPTVRLGPQAVETMKTMAANVTKVAGQ